MRNYILFVFLFGCAGLHAQRHGEELRYHVRARGAGFENDEGKFEFEIFRGNIIKTSFKPKDKVDDSAGTVLLQPLTLKWDVSSGILGTINVEASNDIRIEYRDNLLRYFAGDSVILIAELLHGRLSTRIMKEELLSHHGPSFFISSRGYGIFTPGNWDVFIIPGKNADEIMKNYSALTGRK